MKKAFFYCLYSVLVLGALVACIAFGTKNFSKSSNDSTTEQTQEQTSEYATKLEINYSSNTLYVSVGARLTFLDEMITVVPEGKRSEILMQVTPNNNSTNATGIVYEDMNFEVKEVGNYKVTFMVKDSASTYIKDSIIISASDTTSRPYAQFTNIDVMKDQQYALTDLFAVERDVYSVSYSVSDDVVKTGDNLIFTQTGYHSVSFTFSSSYIKFYQTKMLFVQDENTPLPQEPDEDDYATSLELNISKIYLRVGSTIELKNNYFSVTPASKRSDVATLVEPNNKTTSATGCVMTGNKITVTSLGVYKLSISVQSGADEYITKNILIYSNSSSLDPFVSQNDYGRLYPNTEYSLPSLYTLSNAEEYESITTSSTLTVKNGKCTFSAGGTANIKFGFDKTYYSLIYSFDINVNNTPDYYFEEYAYNSNSISVELADDEITLLVVVKDRNNLTADQNFSITIDDTSVAEVVRASNPPEVVIALKKTGSATITITNTDDSNVKYIITLTVT